MTAAASLDRVFHALADPTRRAILARVRSGPASVGEVAAPFPMSLPAVSKHIKVLEGAGLLRRERRGRTHMLHAEPDPLREAEAWIAHYRQFWDERLDALEALLETLPDEEDR